MKIILREDGPLAIELSGSYRIGLNGEEEREATPSKPRLSLCRCGASQNKPFCDSSHKAIGFKALGGEIEFEPHIEATAEPATTTSAPESAPIT